MGGIPMRAERSTAIGILGLGRLNVNDPLSPSSHGLWSNALILEYLTDFTYAYPDGLAQVY